MQTRRPGADAFIQRELRSRSVQAILQAQGYVMINNQRMTLVDGRLQACRPTTPLSPVEAALQAARRPASRRDSLQDLDLPASARTQSASDAGREDSAPVTPRAGDRDPDSEERCQPS